MFKQERLRRRKQDKVLFERWTAPDLEDASMRSRAANPNSIVRLAISSESFSFKTPPCSLSVHFYSFLPNSNSCFTQLLPCNLDLPSDSRPSNKK